MKAYILIEKDAKIEPFGEHPRSCLIANKTLCSWQREALISLGIGYQIAETAGCPENEHLVFGETLYFTPEFLSHFITKSRKAGVPTVCALKSGVATKRSAVELQNVERFSDHVRLKLWYFPEKSRKVSHPYPILMDCDQFDCRVPVPDHMCGDGKGYAVPMTDSFAIQIDHWVNLWAANIFTVLANIARIRKMPKWKSAPWKIFRGLNRIGKGCKIHRTACIEASVLGDNVTIEAGAIVRASIIGNNVHIGNGVVVEESVLGEGCKLLHGHILFSAFGLGTFSVSNFISASLTGNDCFIGANATFCDFRFGGKNVLALKSSEKIDSGNVFLGCCFGNKAHIGGGCVIAPGRVVPNGWQVCKKDGVFKGSKDDEGIQVLKR